MTWSLDWTPAAIRDFYEIPSWRTAALVDDYLGRFAETGEGPCQRAQGSRYIRLLVPPYAALLTRDRKRRALVVWRIVRYAK